VQSLWSNPEYIKFKSYTNSLEKTFKNMPENEQQKSLQNWKKGYTKMKQIAVGYGVDYNVTPGFVQQSEVVEIVNIRGIGEIGLTQTGTSHWKRNGLNIFAADWLNRICEKAKDRNEAREMIIDLITRFDGEVVDA